MEKPPIKILIVDDHPLLVQGIKASLQEAGYENITTTDTCDKAFALLKTHRNTAPFQVLFTDLSFDNTTEETQLDSGEALIRALKDNFLNVKKVVLTGHSETNRVYSVIQNLDPDAYLLKGKSEAKELDFAIAKIMANEKYYTHEIHHKLMRRKVVSVQMDETAIQILKELPKHVKVANLEGVIKKGGVFIKKRAIEIKIRELRDKLDATTNLDLVLKAKELGIID